jgi:hypothetical protein
MSKKSRRRNRKILGALAALGGAAMLANRRRNASIADNEAKESGLDIKIPTPKKVTTSKTIQDNKPKVFPKLKVDSIGNVIKSGVNTGVGNKKTKFINRDPNMGTGVGIYQGGKKVSDLNPKAINVLSDGSIMAGGVTYPNKAAYANRNKVNKVEPVENVTIPEENFNTSEFDYFNSFARGGRVKKKPFAKRGFGRAYKRSK